MATPSAPHPESPHPEAQRTEARLEAQRTEERLEPERTEARRPEPESTEAQPTEVSTVSTAFLRQLDDERESAMRTASHPGSAFDGADAALHDRLEELVEADRPEMLDLMLDLAEHPEVAFEEHRSARAIVDVLAAHGIEAQLGVHGLDTAIRAEISGMSGTRPAGPGAAGAGAAGAESAGPGADASGVGVGADASGVGAGVGADAAGAGAAGAGVGDDVPTLAILSEYDALPVVGHGCGHNVIAVMGLGAFLALAALAKADPSAVPGRVVFLGTPAEEGHTGKEYMARNGAFDGLDAAVMAHPYGYDLADQVWLGRRTLTVEFHGHTAHASAQPFMGRNALDAASLMYQGIGLMRQQTPPSDRIHAVIREGGDRASVVPDYAKLDLYVRSQRPETLKDLSSRVEDVARGAALMAGVGVSVNWDQHPPSLPVRTNEALTGSWVQAQRRRGRDPLPFGVVSPILAASTDFGNVSYRIPGIHPVIRIAPPEVALHTREFATWAVSEDARAAASDGAYGLAATVLDALHDPQLATAMAAEFEEAGGAIDVPSFFD
ncbi:M20 family peptidase [Brachybacterium sp. JB7]|uniref:Peptidase M20 n=1 Tax=Brachybacterium alimentarium TaxID=47845 RepID=A0A2A3YEJ1_9MICO|nr:MULTISPECIES: amidohydrolase [Brachybacterium]PCC31363.1 peptidase M20 [Brachybacterium alimentarium]PCC37753.1 peptidase M20 [Brachybacterium alimentarium]RCS57824.1 M20 family peptidase [Brachybacterium sp. JB7]RCS65359.1 M20 family peptidase [Brachybacterium alimentarium]RCS77768.1 M20 family peptidase [Brachybacterium alimentarium]